MPKLREALEEVGFDAVRTYLQSGNVVLSSALAPTRVAAVCKRTIADDFGFDLEVLVRSKAQLAAIVQLDLLSDVAANPKRYQVTFLAAKPKREIVERLQALAAGKERLAAHGRELYAWYPNGIGRSKLAAHMASKNLGVAATARNWATVTALLELAND
jgi:uncharacterized protein (DUF1697 family)